MPDKNKPNSLEDLAASKDVKRVKGDLIQIGLILGVTCDTMDQLKELLVERNSTLLLGLNGWTEMQHDGRVLTRVESVAITLNALGKYAEVKFPVKFGEYYSKVVPIVRQERLEQAKGRIIGMDNAAWRPQE